MRLVVLEMCALFVIAVLAVVSLAIWSTRGASGAQTTPRQRFATGIVWAAIPGLMMLAAAALAVIGVVA